MSDAIKYRNRTWNVLKREPDKWLLEWYDPKKPGHASNYAIRWVSVEELQGGRGFYASVGAGFYTAGEGR